MPTYALTQSLSQSAMLPFSMLKLRVKFSKPKRMELGQHRECWCHMNEFHTSWRQKITILPIKLTIPFTLRHTSPITALLKFYFEAFSYAGLRTAAILCNVFSSYTTAGLKKPADSYPHDIHLFLFYLTRKLQGLEEKWFCILQAPIR